METTIVYRGYIGILENNMETTIGVLVRSQMLATRGGREQREPHGTCADTSGLSYPGPSSKAAAGQDIAAKVPFGRQISEPSQVILRRITQTRIFPSGLHCATF